MKHQLYLTCKGAGNTRPLHHWPGRTSRCNIALAQQGGQNCDQLLSRNSRRQTCISKGDNTLTKALANLKSGHQVPDCSKAKKSRNGFLGFGLIWGGILTVLTGNFASTFPVEAPSVSRDKVTTTTLAYELAVP